jgi:hypothetical protein
MTSEFVKKQVAAYNAVSSFTELLEMELDSKTRLVQQLSAKRSSLMVQVHKLDDEICPLLDRLDLLQRELKRFKGVA